MIVLCTIGFAISFVLEYYTLLPEYNRNVNDKFLYVQKELMNYSDPLIDTDENDIVMVTRNRIYNATDISELESCFSALKNTYTLVNKSEPMIESRVLIGFDYYYIAVHNRWDSICNSFYRFLFPEICENNRYI